MWYLKKFRTFVICIREEDHLKLKSSIFKNCFACSYDHRQHKTTQQQSYVHVHFLCPHTQALEEYQGTCALITGCHLSHQLPQLAAHHSWSINISWEESAKKNNNQWNNSNRLKQDREQWNNENAEISCNWLSAKSCSHVGCARRRTHT